MSNEYVSNYFLVEKNKTCQENLRIIPGKWYLRCCYRKEDDRTLIISRELIKIIETEWLANYYYMTYTKLSLTKENYVVYKAKTCNIHCDSNHIQYTADRLNFTLEELTEEKAITWIKYLLSELLGPKSLNYINTSYLSEKVCKDIPNTVENYLKQHRYMSSLKGRYLKVKDKYRTIYFQIHSIQICKPYYYIVNYILAFFVRSSNEIEYQTGYMRMENSTFLNGTIITKKEFNEARNNKKND